MVTKNNQLTINDLRIYSPLYNVAIERTEQFFRTETGSKTLRVRVSGALIHRARISSCFNYRQTFEGAKFWQRVQHGQFEQASLICPWLFTDDFKPELIISPYRERIVHHHEFEVLKDYVYIKDESYGDGNAFGMVPGMLIRCIGSAESGGHLFGTGQEGVRLITDGPEAAIFMHNQVELEEYVTLQDHKGFDNSSVIAAAAEKPKPKSYLPNKAAREEADRIHKARRIRF